MKRSQFGYQVIAKTSLMATHHWPEAPERRAYLRDLHAHMFNVTGKADIDIDREVEFHDLKEIMDLALAELTLKHRGKGKLPSFGSLSCESIAQHILSVCPILIEVTVFEDESCGSTVRRSDQDLMDRPIVVTLCGSTRFKDEYRKAECDLERQGYAVMSVGSFPHADGENLDPDLKISLDILHKQKIALSDAIYVINPNGYIGSSTASEIDMARKLHKAVLYMETPK